MVKNADYLRAFGDLGKSTKVQEITEDVLESYTCRLYGVTTTNCVNEARFQLFERKYKTPGSCRHRFSALRKIKGLNSCSMPPCKDTLKEKLMRANYVALKWKNAGEEIIENEPPEDHGWLKSGSLYEIKWFGGDQIPPSDFDVLTEEEDAADDDDDDNDDDDNDDGSNNKIYDDEEDDVDDDDNYYHYYDDE
jgi:hypothetical protein